jgi:Ni/Co efflux regulator RcnB
MKHHWIIALTALASLASSLAWADGHRHHRERDHWHEHERHDDRRHNHRRGHRDDHVIVKRYKVVRYVHPPGYRHRAWHRGAHLPRAYRAPRYIVHDYGAYRLHAPPRGHHWVRIDRDVVLAVVATGVVAHVISDIFY